jgi:lysophospholipase L1-like esterase
MALLPSLLLASLAAAAIDVAVPGLDRRVVVTGAAELDDEAGVVLRFSSAGVRVRFRGTARFVLDPVDDAVVEAAGGDRFALVDDDEDARAAATSAGAPARVPDPPVLVDDTLVVHAPVPRTVTFTKTSEAFFGARRVVAVVVDGELFDAPARPTLLVLGDSWAAGFGVRGDLVDETTGRAPGPSCPFASDTSDVRLAWPSVLARRARVDVAVVALSGRGVLRDWQGDERPTTVPEAFRRAALAVDVDRVIVALGHNDANEGLPDRARFAAAWHALVDDVVAMAPHAPIVALAPAFDDDAPPAEPRSQSLRAWMAHPRVVVVDEPAMPVGLGRGCVWHPGTRAQQAFAAALERAAASRPDTLRGAAKE